MLVNGRATPTTAPAARRRLPTLCLACMPLLALAQQEMEIITLRHRTPEQVLPAIRPLLEPGGAISGMNDQLILRASGRNREQIRQALAAIDKPVRRLLIQVSQNRDAQGGQQGAVVAGRVEAGEHGVAVQPPAGMQGSARMAPGAAELSVTLPAQDWRGAQLMGSSTQMVQVVEGGRALIQVGHSLPMPLRRMAFGPSGLVVSEGVVYQDLGQGFYAAPRVVGDRVTLEISPQFDSPGPYGTVNTQRLSTTVAGRLGEWMALGGSSQQASAGVAGNQFGGGSQGSSIWLKVEELP